MIMITVIFCPCPHEKNYPTWACKTCKEWCEPKDKEMMEECSRKIAEAVSKCIEEQLHL